MSPRLPAALSALALCAALAAGGCSSDDQPSPVADSSSPGPSGSGPSGGPPPTPSGASGAIKPVLKGLLDRDGAPPATHLGTAVSGWVVNTTWAAMQPAKDGPLAANNPVDKALAEIQTYADTHPGSSIGLRLRIRAGTDAPEWAKSLGGEPVSLSEPQGGGTGTIGRFWTSEFGRSYANLQNLLAQKYDGVPQVREVAISRCTTFYSEPFIRGKGDPGNVAALRAAGFTTAADHQCLREQVDAHKVWQRTNSSLSLNPYQDIDRRPAAGGPAGPDDAFTETMMVYCRSVLGSRCVLQNNSLRDPPKYARMYAKMKELGPPLAFQTAAPKRIGDLAATLRYADAFGADSVELPQSYRREPAADVAPYNATLKK